MPYQCEIQEQSAQPVLSIRTKTSIQELPKVLGEAYRTIAEFLGKSGEQPSGPPFAAYYNMDMQNLDVEAGFPVSHVVAGQGDVQASEIPAGKFATTLHTGPYSDIEPAYQALTKWIDENGHQPAGVAYEMYLNDPAVTPAQELLTRILMPLK
ncbi:MAG: GyrI-like domain-containing protein [Fidelibacterota bacterium]|nr:MAG: GyrI-like domain-containing protein [Candidatus Neomarinimicrobiota bacterium]